MTIFLRILFLLSIVTTTLRATGTPSGFTLNLPFAANAATPVWLGQPVVNSNPFATLDLPIMPPDATASLLITVFFQEQNGGFLRISWQSGAETTAENEAMLPGPGEVALSSVLADNFYEGIGMSNQRSLLISADVLKQPGSLRFEAGAATLGITSIRMEWLEEAVGLASPAIQDVLVTPANGQSQPASELSGLPPLAQDPAWQGRIVNVPVTDVPLRIEEGLDFSVQINSLPTFARVALKEAGLPWGQHLVAWVNNQRAGILIPDAPPLDDGGYTAAANGDYVGWREGSFFVPVSTLAAGANTLQFSAEPDAGPDASAPPDPTPAPLAVKDVVLQLSYPALAPAGPSPATTTSSAPADDVQTNVAATAPTSTASSAPKPAPTTTP